MGSVSMVRSDPRQSFGTISPLFSGYTISLPGRVSGEQQGGAAEILSLIGVDHGNWLHLRILGWNQDRSSPTRLKGHCRHAFGFDSACCYLGGWMIVSGCTWVSKVGLAYL